VRVKSLKFWLSWQFLTKIWRKCVSLTNVSPSTDN
jgi:hypothetical protein